MSVTIETKKDNILEYQEHSRYHTMICDSNGKENYVASEINKWIFPGKIYSIPTGICLFLPENSIAILARCLSSTKLEIIPQIIACDGFINIQVRNIGILPIKIFEKEILASLHIIPKLECHVVPIKSC